MLKSTWKKAKFAEWSRVGDAGEHVARFGGFHVAIVSRYCDDTTWTARVSKLSDVNGRNSDVYCETMIHVRKGFATAKAAKAWADARTAEMTVTATNAMSGAEFQESIRTPYYCSPASETYWSA